MTELTTFLVALYDSLSEAEMEAFAHGQARMASLAESGRLPADVSVPVYHATDMNVSLDVGLEVKQTETGEEVHLTQPPPEDESRMTFTVDVFDLVETRDVTDVDPKDVIEDLPNRLPGSSVGRPSEPPTGEMPSREDTDANDGTPNAADEPDSPPARVTEAQPVAAIDAFEPSTATILEASGIETVADLLTRTPEEIAETVDEAGDAVSTDRAATWREEAQAAVTALGVRERERPVEDVEGIGPAYGERLRESGIETFEDLAGYAPEKVAEIVSTDHLTVTPRRAEHWIEEAEGRIAEAETNDPDDGDPTE